MNDSAYKEMMENAASYNTRLSSERTMRLPFLDSQTGKENHLNSSRKIGLFSPVQGL